MSTDKFCPPLPPASGEDPALEQTRAALAPTLEATAAILPWVATPRPPRFDPKLDARWQDASNKLAEAWAARYRIGPEHIRPPVFELCAIALELADVDCLRLTEALATASDLLEQPGSLDNPRLTAALAACIECLIEPDGLEHPLFPERARTLAARLEKAGEPTPNSVRTPTLDRLFLTEADECLDRLHEAFEVLPADAYGAREAALHIAQAAEPLELNHIVNLAHRLALLLSAPPGQHTTLDADVVREEALALIEKLEIATSEIAADLSTAY